MKKKEKKNLKTVQHVLDISTKISFSAQLALMVRNFLCSNSNFFFLF